jgi:hypothetical protein
MRVPSSSVQVVIGAALVAVLGLSGCGASDGQGSTNTSTTRPSVTSVAIENAAARRFVDAVNSGSTDRIMATLADRAVVIDSGRRFADRQAIRAWVDAEIIDVRGRITVRREHPTTGGTELRVDFNSSGFNGTDLRYRFTTENDLIISLTLG